MNVTDEDLSAWLDGDLPADRIAAIAQAVAASGPLQQRAERLRALRTAASRLAAIPPERELWPGIARRIGQLPTTRRWWLPLLAASLFGMLPGAALAWWWLRDQTPAPAGERFVLLLHEGAGMTVPANEAEAATIVARYRAWAAAMAAKQALELGEKLRDGEGYVLQAKDDVPRTQRNGIGGLFILRAPDYAAARELARTCPHLQYGGTIELRRIHDT